MLRPPTSPLFPYTTLFRSLETARGVEPGVRVRRRVYHDRAPGEGLDFVSHAAQQLAVRLDRLELRRRELERERQQQPLRGRAVARELVHHRLVQHALVRRVLIYDRDPGVSLEEEVGVEDLKQGCQGPGVGCQGLWKQLLRRAGGHHATDAGPCTPDTRHLAPDT